MVQLAAKARSRGFEGRRSRVCVTRNAICDCGTSAQISVNLMGSECKHTLHLNHAGGFRVVSTRASECDGSFRIILTHPIQGVCIVNGLEIAVRKLSKLHQTSCPLSIMAIYFTGSCACTLSVAEPGSGPRSSIPLPSLSLSSVSEIIPLPLLSLSSMSETASLSIVTEPSPFSNAISLSGTAKPSVIRKGDMKPFLITVTGNASLRRINHLSERDTLLVANMKKW